MSVKDNIDNMGSDSRPIDYSFSPDPDELKKIREASCVLDGLMKNENISIAVVQGIPPVMVLVNRGIALLTGYSEIELMGFEMEEIKKLVHPDYRETFFQRYFNRLKGEDESKAYEMRIVRKDGETRWVSAFVNLIEYSGRLSVVVSLIDITESKNTETALRVSREKYKLLFERTPAGIMYYDNNMVIQHFNRKLVEIFNSTKKALTGFDLHTINDQPILHCLETPLKGKKAHYDGSYRAINGDSQIVVSIRTEPLFSDDGSITGGVAIIEDRTRQYVTEEALLQSERRFKEMIDHSPLPITVVNNEARMVYSNASSFKLFGYSADDVPDLETWWKRAYPDPEYRKLVVKEWIEGYQQMRRTGKPYGPSEHRVTSADGSVHDIEFHVVPLGDFSFIIMNDMTRHRKAEAELLRTKKIESIGILAGGIAHDFNNILTAILGNVSLARMEIHGNDQVDQILDIVEKSTWRAKDLTQQLLTFSQGGAPVRRVTSISTLLSDTAEFILRGSGIKCEFDIAADLWNADVDEGQISQVIHNIVLNARQAMSDSGTLRLSAANYHCDTDELPLDKGDYLRILIEDSGPGIGEDLLPNIFDPFFTTKSSGSGLGLSVTDSIIRKHGGHIRVLRSGDTGSVFEIILPGSQEVASVGKGKQKIVVDTNYRVLVMDDDELVLDICARMLEKMGYSTVKVKDGDEAVRVYMEAFEAGHRFDCVIMDLTIPGGPGGREVIKILKQFDPGIRAIVSSGYSNDPVMSQYRDYGFAGVSVKPYSYDELRAAVSAAISYS
ncbi:MAG TPA: PAS domain S-box protein [Spirochaetota bacterium]|nr:PAS domain S-box protein [Spirochaetota bacterium]